ncbi:F-box only protein 47-like isoform X2 [Dreissena polymorpha]|uniref:FBXO47 ARM repeats region domain-containing protein n=2 Tax=Dreissena polymorpha TaxID=45954 RepID=A0A9D4N3V3_DREPO|nr:F-box only protein 47-like isoform X2 [Dreissena polymorpha]XP_052229072.1 F-box only protein 47-like isoform X2 [Dreissena polymorpha]XP_052229076.1 F-box only protein 47-like isoform X2 [Dreissena polymorpha]KAH3887320.1 hypothetical protein DPMN_011335 [Dreissena polymorpha]
MNITHYMPCKKPRRSTRLEFKEKEAVKEKSVQSSPLGFFDMFPVELKLMFLKYLSVEDLSNLTITSKVFRNLVEGFLTIHPILKKDIVDRIHIQSKYLPMPAIKHTDYIQLFGRLGLLIKRSTCLYSTKDRLKFINEVLTKLLCCNYTEHCEDLSMCLAMSCFGKFLHTVIAGWDDCECVRAYEAICSHTCLMKNVKLVLMSKSGSHQRLEFEIRCFFRRVFLDPCSSIQDKAFWMTRILKPWPLVYQARLIFLIYGPVLEDEILWFELSENTPAVNSVQSSQHMGGLANALQILHHYKQEWSEDDVVSIIDEMTSSPEEWLAENMAHLLILCGDVITSKLLISKAINGRMMELSSLITSFCLVCVKNSLNLDYVIAMIRHVLRVIDSAKDRQIFSCSITDMFKELIIDIHEFEEGQGNDMFYMVTSMAEFTKKIMMLAFKEP